MPIRPIDIMKTQEASQYKYYENQRSQHEQIQIAKSFQNHIQQEQSKTTQAAKSENSEYRYDAKEKGQNSYSNSQGRKQKKEEQKKDTEKPNKTGGIDILI